MTARRLQLRRRIEKSLPRVLLLAAAIGVASAGCASRGAQTSASGGSATPNAIEVVTTTTVFADLIRNVGGDRIRVTSLVPRNGDVHTFSPRPSDIATIARAKLLVMNGLGLDDWLTRAMSSAASGGARLVRLAVGLPGVTLLPGESASTQNPHLWLDVKYAELYVDRIASVLAQVDPGDDATFQANARAYRQRLEALDSWVRDQTSRIAMAARKLVTFHDAFPYYAREYGITIVGVAVQAPGQDPSAAYTARLIDEIRTEGVKAIFSEKQFPPKLVDAIAAQTGARVVSTLYDDALGDPPITSYEAVIRWDTQQLVSALGGAT